MAISRIVSDVGRLLGSGFNIDMTNRCKSTLYLDRLFIGVSFPVHVMASLLVRKRCCQLQTKATVAPKDQMSADLSNVPFFKISEIL